MDPLLLAVEWWWLAPVAAGGVAAGAVGMGRRRTAGGRRLEFDAARHDLRAARQKAVQSRMAVKLARADVTRISAERSARRATAEQVAGAKRMLRIKAIGIELGLKPRMSPVLLGALLVGPIAVAIVGIVLGITLGLVPLLSR